MCTCIGALETSFCRIRTLFSFFNPVHVCELDVFLGLFLLVLMTFMRCSYYNTSRDFYFIFSKGSECAALPLHLPAFPRMLLWMTFNTQFTEINCSETVQVN